MKNYGLLFAKFYSSKYHNAADDVKLSAIVLSYAFNFQKAKCLLKRLSRNTFIAANYIASYKIDGKMILNKKLREIPILSSNTLVVRGCDHENVDLR